MRTLFMICGFAFVGCDPTIRIGDELDGGMRTQPVSCRASNCSGCCDSSGACVLGEDVAACGKGGVSCARCEQSCSLGSCTQLSAPGVSVTGAINGTPFVAKSAAAQLYTGGVSVRISEHDAVCNPASTVGFASAGKRILVLSTSASAEVTPGQYPVTLWVGAPACTEWVNRLNPLEPISTGTGTMTITQIENRLIATFSGSLSSGASITGRVESDYCELASHVLCVQ